MGAAAKINGLSLGVRVVAPLAVGSAGYAAWRTNWPVLARSFLTGPGRTSRILLVFFLFLNWKNLPFAWTYRIFSTIVYHSILRKSPLLGPRALFKPIISQTKAPLLEIDYNLHKSNSTYFADLDISRTHLVSYLCRPALRNLTYNSRTKLVLDPKSGQPVKGPLGIMLGSVACSFRREIAAYKTFEMWSRVLTWDRKWFYIVTHFMPKGTAKPTEWLDPGFGKLRTRGVDDPSGGWQKKIHATAISKYVFKLGRLTIHPAVVLGDSGLLPERPGGWMDGESQLGDLTADVSDVNLSRDGEWDWRRVEAQRRQGMEIASQFSELDALDDTFDGGNFGALGRFGPG